MSTRQEIEKKYRFKDQKEFDDFRAYLEATYVPTYYSTEENILYSGNQLEGFEVLRVRNETRNGEGLKHSITYKGAALTNSEGMKVREEIELDVTGDFPNLLLERLGFKPTLIYEKKRECWSYDHQYWEIALDELPFGYFLEVEGTEEEIRYLESSFSPIPTVETKSYPELARYYTESVGGLIEARFRS